MYSALNIARKLVALADKDIVNSGEGLTNLKLQKLLYYQQGYHLAIFDSPLFEEEIEAWMYGPVVPSVYREYQKYGSQPIPVEDCNVTLSPEEEDVFFQTYDAYRDFSAIGLMNKTHQETPWASLSEHSYGVVITKESMRDYFKTKLN